MTDATDNHAVILERMDHILEGQVRIEAKQDKTDSKLHTINSRLFVDNGTTSFQTTLKKHDAILRVIVWASAITVGTALVAWVNGWIGIQ